MLRAFSLCFFLISLHVASHSHKSTPHLPDIVLARCYEYQLLKNASIERNCTRLWELFHTAFSFKEPCNTFSTDYTPFFDEIGMYEVRPNKTLFWSGTFKEAHVFSDFDNRFTTLEDTMAGWMMNNLWWCGSTDPGRLSDGINYTDCPQPSPSCDYIAAFWGHASKKFAESARGIVRVMVNGSRTGRHAYSRESFFGKKELPNLKVDQINELIVIVVHNINGPRLETCANGSVKVLQEDAKQRGIQTRCLDDPDNVRHLLCTDYPNSRMCLFLGGPTKAGNSTVTGCTAGSIGVWKTVAITMTATTALFITVGVLLMIYMKCSENKKLPYENMEINNKQSA